MHVHTKNVELEERATSCPKRQNQLVSPPTPNEQPERVLKSQPQQMDMLILM